MDPVKVDIAEIERQIMSEAVTEKTWQIAAHGGKGPVMITVRMPEVTVTDSEGRHIVISPEQADVVSSRLGDIAYWIDIVVLDQPGLDAVIVEPDPVALVVEVTSPSTAWVDRLVKPDAYAGAGIPHFLRVDLDRTGQELEATSYALAPDGYLAAARAAGGRLTLKEPFLAELDLTVLATATRYPGID